MNQKKEMNCVQRNIFMKALYQKALDYSTGSVLILDPNANILYCNDLSANMVGLSKEELLQLSMYDVIERKLAEDSAGIEAIHKRKEIVRKFANYRGEMTVLYAKPIIDTSNILRYVFVYSWYEATMQNLWKQNGERNRSSRQQTSVSNKAQEPFFISDNQEMKAIYSLCERVAKTDCAILIMGESGTGKEVLANFVHKNSKRSHESFIPVNCACIPESLIESELFGYEKGSFTGALREGKEGIFEAGSKGTVFLDEIGDLPLSAQAKLLRVLETGEYRRIGGVSTQITNARIISATNRDLKKMVKEGLFREDLYYRLNVIPVDIPPLRKRKEDVERFALSFLDYYNRKHNKNVHFSADALYEFKRYEWEGNVRELRNTVERLVLITTDDIITCTQLSVFGGLSSKDNQLECVFPEDIMNAGLPLKEAVAVFEDIYIKKVLNETNGNISQAAKRLGIHRTNMYAKMKDRPKGK